MTSHPKMLALLLGLSAIAVARGADSPANEPLTNMWQVQVGWVHQWGRGMSVKGPAPTVSANALSPLLGNLPIVSGSPTATYPDNGLLTDRNFDDGYVRLDYWTGDSGLLVTDPTRYAMTWNWGCDHASQYNYDSGNHPTLSFHINQGEAQLGAATLTGRNSDDELPTDGVEVKFSRRLHAWTNVTQSADNPNLSCTNISTTLDLMLGAAWFPMVRQHVSRQATLGVYGVSETYTYLDYYGTSAGGSWPPLDVPYQGIFGDAFTAGPLIPARPESWDYSTDLLGTARDRVSIETEIWHLRGELGLTLTREITPRLSVYVSPQFVLEFVDMRASRSETLTYTDAQSGSTTTLSSPTRNKHRMEVVPGVLLTTGADYLISENWFVGASLGWEWLSKQPSIRVGPSRICFDLDGGEFSLYVGRHF